MGETAATVSKSRLTVTWPGHHQVLVDTLWNLFLEHYKIDVEISCNGHTVKAHQLILAMFLPGFKDILRPGGDRFVNFDGIIQSREEIDLLIEFIYRGKVTVTDDRVASLLSLAEILGVKELVNAITKSKNNANQREAKLNIKEAEKFILIKPEELSKTKRFRRRCSTSTKELDSENARMSLEEFASSCKEHPHEDCDKQPFKSCSHCTFRSRCEIEMANHQFKHDASFKRHKCEVCGKCFTGKSSFKKHLLIHGDPENLFNCTFCDFHTTDNQRLIVHLNVSHKVDSVGKPITAEFKCKQCEFVAVNKVQLSNHVSRKHHQKNSYKCRECEYTANTHKVIARHESMVHRNERPYMCELCGARQKSANHLKEHMRAHEGLKPYKCHICNKDFARVNSLNVHLRLHSGVARFICNICGGGFQKRYRFAAHLQRKHNLILDIEKAFKDKDSFVFPIIATQVQDVAAVDNKFASDEHST